ncbi:hypothetical protein D3C76_467440 [compost metagenome]
MLQASFLEQGLAKPSADLFKWRVVTHAFLEVGARQHGWQFQQIDVPGIFQYLERCLAFPQERDLGRGGRCLSGQILLQQCFLTLYRLLAPGDGQVLFQAGEVSLFLRQGGIVSVHLVDGAFQRRIECPANQIAALAFPGLQVGQVQ